MSYKTDAIHYIECDNCGKVEPIKKPTGEFLKRPWRRLWLGGGDMEKIIDMLKFLDDFDEFELRFELCSEECEYAFRAKYKNMIKLGFYKCTKQAYKLLDGIESMVGQ